MRFVHRSGEGGPYRKFAHAFCLSVHGLHLFFDLNLSLREGPVGFADRAPKLIRPSRSDDSFMDLNTVFMDSVWSVCRSAIRILRQDVQLSSFRLYMCQIKLQIKAPNIHT